MGDVLLPIVGVAVGEAARIEAEERIVGEEERTAAVGSERKRDAVEVPAVGEVRTADPAVVIDRRIGGVPRCRRGEDVGDQALVPAVDGVVHRPPVHRAPMPVEAVRAAGIPVPFDRRPQAVDDTAELALLSLRARKILSRREQAGHQKGRLDEVAAIVLVAEGNRAAAVAVEPMRKGAMVALRLVEEMDHGEQTIEGRLSSDPSTFHTSKDGHDAEAGAADRNDTRRLVASFAGKTGGRMGEIPEIADRLPLYRVEKLVGLGVGGRRLGAPSA